MTWTSDSDHRQNPHERLRAQLDDASAARLAGMRGDPAVRALHARCGLLRWVYEQRQTGVRVPFSDSAYGWLATGRYQVEGDRFSDPEVRAAADFLGGAGLIEAVPGRRPGVRGLRITQAGRDCVENYGGEVAVYVKEQARV